MISEASIPVQPSDLSQKLQKHPMGQVANLLSKGETPRLVTLDCHHVVNWDFCPKVTVFSFDTSWFWFDIFPKVARNIDANFDDHLFGHHDEAVKKLNFGLFQRSLLNSGRILLKQNAVVAVESCRICHHARTPNLLRKIEGQYHHIFPSPSVSNHQLPVCHLWMTHHQRLVLRNFCAVAPRWWRPPRQWRFGWQPLWRLWFFWWPCQHGMCFAKSRKKMEIPKKKRQ